MTSAAQLVIWLITNAFDCDGDCVARTAPSCRLRHKIAGSGALSTTGPKLIELTNPIILEAFVPKSLGNHAVVLGAGMAGLAAAQVLSNHFGTVTILERDLLPAEPAPRSGTPQAPHAHALLAGGMQALQSLFPNFEHDLVNAGAVRIRAGRDIRLDRPGYDPFPSRDLGFDTFFMSRALLEAVTRRHVQENPNT